jgi:phosphoglycerate dehydrogenase-like enzyme/glyoxylase-like metal-dependent hydrolase (beta-lactamase superfamily II)
MGHLLAIDAGTGGCRAVVFSDEGRPLAAARRRWAQAADPDHPGSVDSDTRAAWALVAECVRDSLAGMPTGDVGAVSATSVRGGLVLFDAAGTELWACGSTDARAADQVRWVRRRDPEFEAEAYRSSGQTLATAALPRLLWLRDRLPRVYEAAATLGMISDWILARLSGEHAADPANAGTTGLFSLTKRSWAPELAGRWGLRTDLLPPVDQLVPLLGDAQVLLVHAAPVSRAAVAAAGALRVVGTVCGGTVNLNLEALSERGIPVFNTPGRNAQAVAEFVTGALIAHLRGIVTAAGALRAGRWSMTPWTVAGAGMELAGKTCGMVGFGQVARAFTPIAHGIGMRLLATDPWVDPAEVAQAGVEPVVLEELLERSDVVVLMARYDGGNRHLIDGRALARMPPGAVLVDTARPQLVDTEALRAALREERIAGAILDVFDQEPPADEELLALPGALLTPHIAGASRDTVLRGAVADYSIWVLEFACAPHSPAGFLIHGQQGTRELPYSLTLLQSAQRTVLVDTGFVNDGFSRTLGELDGITRWTHPATVLARVGVDPGEVDTILLTHAHYDHLGTLDAFPNAVAWLQERELFGWIRAPSRPPELQWLKDGVNLDDLTATVELTRQGRLRLARWARPRRAPRALPGADVRHPHLRPPARRGRQRARRSWVLPGDAVFTYANLDGVDGGQYVPIGYATGSQERCILAMDQMMRTVDGRSRRIVPGHEVLLWERHRSRCFEDGLHVAEVSLRPGDTSRLE